MLIFYKKEIKKEGVISPSLCIFIIVFGFVENLFMGTAFQPQSVSSNEEPLPGRSKCDIRNFLQQTPHLNDLIGHKSIGKDIRYKTIINKTSL